MVERPAGRVETLSGWTAGLFALGFRPLFLLAPLWSALAMTAWLTALGHAGPAPITTLWHAHEMVFGFGGAVVVGFLLTAVRNWTGLPTPAGAPLVLMVTPWLAARGAALAGQPAAVAGADALFLGVAAAAIARPVVCARQWRNLRFPAYTAALAVAAGSAAAFPRSSAWIGLAIILALLAAVAGRVIPFFISRRLPGARPARRLPRVSAVLEVAVLVAVAAAPLAPVPSAMAAALGAPLAGWRLRAWSRPAAWREPMLAVLLGAQALLVLGLLALAAAAVGSWPLAGALHLLAIGAMALSMFGMMARVALGHTGRTIAADAALRWVFVVLAAVALLRGVALAWLPAHYLGSVRLAALAWLAAALLFCWRLAPVLIRPRVDGRPG